MRKIVKQLVALGLAVTMIGSLTACKSETKKTDTKSATATESKDSKDGKEKEVVTLKAFTMGNEPSGGMDKFYEQLDALTVKDLGCKVRFDFIPWGDEKNKINLNITSGEYDLYVGGNFSDYKATATKNAFLDLKPYLKDVPDLVEHYKQASDKALEICEINGHLYGIPQLSKAEGGAGEGFIYRDDLRQEWGLPEINSLETMEKYLYAAKADKRYKNTPIITDNRIWTSLFAMLSGDKYKTMEIGDYAFYSYSDPSKVINILDTPEFKQVVKYAQKWYKDGIIDHDILATEDNAGTKGFELMKADKKPCETNTPFWSATNNYIPGLYTAHPEWKIGFYDYLLDNPNYKNVYIPDYSVGSVISVAAKCKYPDIALKFIEKAHTDRTYYDLLMYGVQGENYKMVDGIPSVEGIAQDNIKPSWTGLNDGYMNYQTKSVNPDWQALQDKYKAMGDKLLKDTNYIPSPKAGFTFDVTNLSTQIASMETVKAQYFLPLVCGITKDVDGDIAKVKAQYEKAGMKEYFDELQKQYDKFNAAK
jgi:Maltose-binding periplasmic proteins/domains